MSPETFSLDEIVSLTLNYNPNSKTQYPTVYRIESPGFTPDRVPMGNFNEQSNPQHQFKAGALEASRIRAVFYNGNREAGCVDFYFEKSDDGSYRPPVSQTK